MENIFAYRNCFDDIKDVKSILLYGNYDDCPAPAVSVCIPTYNNPEYFKYALDSVLGQNYLSSYEIIVVDNTPVNGEKNQTQIYIEKLNKSNIFYFRNEKHIDIFNNWNRCIELARADCLTYCHDDDTLEPDCLNILMGLHHTFPKKLVTSSWNIMDGANNRIYTAITGRTVLKCRRIKKYHGYSKVEMFVHSVGFGEGCLFNKKNLLELGGFNKEYYPSSDYALMTKYLFKYGCVFSEIPTFTYRKAKNESLTAYKDFAARDKFFRECMAERLWLPKVILQRIITANYNCSKIALEIDWGHADKELYNTVSEADKKLLGILFRLFALKNSSFSFILFLKCLKRIVRNRFAKMLIFLFAFFAIFVYLQTKVTPIWNFLYNYENFSSTVKDVQCLKKQHSRAYK